MTQKAYCLTLGKSVREDKLLAGKPAKLISKIDAEGAAGLRQPIGNYLNQLRVYLRFDYPKTENA